MKNNETKGTSIAARIIAGVIAFLLLGSSVFMLISYLIQ